MSQKLTGLAPLFSVCTKTQTAQTTAGKLFTSGFISTHFNFHHINKHASFIYVTGCVTVNPQYDQHIEKYTYIYAECANEINV